MPENFRAGGDVNKVAIDLMIQPNLTIQSTIILSSLKKTMKP